MPTTRVPVRAVAGRRIADGRLGSVGHSAAMGYHPRVFERTELPAGPARHQRPDARCAFRLHRGLRPGRVAPRDRCRSRRLRTSWSTSRSRGRRGVLSTRAISEAIEGLGRLVQRRDRPRVDRVLGRVPSTRGRPGDGCRRRAHRSSGPVGSRHRYRADDHHRGEPNLLPRRSVRVRPDPVPGRDVRGRSAGAGDLRRRGRQSPPCRPTPSATSGGRPTGRPIPSSPSPATSPTTSSVDLGVRCLRDRERTDPDLRPGADAAGRPASRLSASARPARPSWRVGDGAAPRPPRCVVPRGPQRRARRRDEQSPVPERARGARSRLRRLVRTRRLRRRRGPRDLRPA